MTLIVEDGTGLLDAESLISVEEADVYHNKRGNTSWMDLSVPEKERRLRRANDYLTQTYRLQWKGYPVALDQTCDWPRIGVEVSGSYEIVGFDTIPDPVKHAVAELAYRSMSGSLNPDQTQRVVREKVGPMEVEYDRYSPVKTSFAAVSQYLMPYLRSGASGVNAKMVRG
jgi:hypothetical protein